MYSNIKKVIDPVTPSYIIKSLQNQDEIGGFFITQTNFKSQFFKTCSSKYTLKGERKHLILPLRMSNLLWHTHPKMQGFWPSLEDLFNSIVFKQPFNCYINLIFTIYGTWVITGIDSIKNLGK